jgi:hypothetical protein
MWFTPGRYLFKQWNVLGHRHDLRACHLLHKGIAFLVIGVCMASEQNLDVGELEPEILDRFGFPRAPIIAADDADSTD